MQDKLNQKTIVKQEELADLFQFVRENSVTTLELGLDDTGDKSVKFLECNEIGNNGMKYISEALQKNHINLV